MTPRPQLQPQPASPADPLPMSMVAALFANAVSFYKASSSFLSRAVDLSWLARCRDLLLLLGLGLIVHAVHFWSATAAELLTGLMLLWLSCGPLAAKPPVAAKPAGGNRS